MIVDDPGSHFIFSYQPDVVLLGKSYMTYKGRLLTNAEVLLYWGKWIALGDRPRLDVLAERLDGFVEAGVIACLKYDREPSRNLGVEECVLMAYCDKRRRQRVWEILKRHGVELKAWVSERETLEMWGPGGRLLERWIRWNGLGEAAAEATRNDARARMDKIYRYPEMAYAPWEQ